MKNILFWKYKCPKCGKVIDDNDILLPLGGSILYTWNPKNYYGSYFHFHCSKCKAHLAFNWSNPTLKIIAYQIAYTLLALLIYNNSPFRNSYDTASIYGVWSIGVLAIFIIGYLIYSKNARLQTIDDTNEPKKMKNLDMTEMPNADEDFGENEAVLYELGNPDLDDMKEGILEIRDGNLLFKEQYKDKVYFIIPLEQISNVRTEGTLLSSSIYNGMASMGAERNHLYVKFQKDGHEYVATFTNASHNITSTILEKLKKKILKFTLDNTTI